MTEKVTNIMTKRTQKPSPDVSFTAEEAKFIGDLLSQVQIKAHGVEFVTIAAKLESVLTKCGVKIPGGK